jgi:hypothetical protein
VIRWGDSPLAVVVRDGTWKGLEGLTDEMALLSMVLSSYCSFLATGLYGQQEVRIRVISAKDKQPLKGQPTPFLCFTRNLRKLRQN